MGLGRFNSDDTSFTPPYGAHQIVFDAVDEVTGGRFQRGPNGEQAEKRRDDYLLGAALFIDVPDTESAKTGVYFAANMIAEAPNRDIHTQTAVINNYTSIVPEEVVGEDAEFTTEIGVVADVFELIEEEVEKRITDLEVSKSEVVSDTLQGVRSGQSFFTRWGSARKDDRDSAREHGRGKFDL